MIIYEVNLEVLDSSYTAFLAWLREHVAEIITLPGFLLAEISTCEDPIAPRGKRCLCCHYRLHEQADLERYLREDAPRLREEGLKRFPGQFTATRRVLTPLA